MAAATPPSAYTNDVSHAPRRSSGNGWNCTPLQKLVDAMSSRASITSLPRMSSIVSLEMARLPALSLVLKQTAQ